MINLNLKRIMLRKGITKLYTYLRHLGMTHFMATNYLSGKSKTINYGHIEKLCMALHCTPNDLFEWIKTEKDMELSATHPLQAIHHTGTTVNINQLLINANPDTLIEIEQLLINKMSS